MGTTMAPSTPTYGPSAPWSPYGIPVYAHPAVPPDTVLVLHPDDLLRLLALSRDTPATPEPGSQP